MKKKCLYISLARFFGCLILAGIPVNLASNRFYDKSWTIGEWLVSYAGGFVRRGLPGTVIYEITSSLKINPIYLIWFISILAYSALCWLVCVICRKQFDDKLLLSPAFLLAPIIGDFLVAGELRIAALQ